jgi:hypothetical protein
VARNYTHRTIKTLFGEASKCAYPGCDQPLIFHDRAKATAIAEIAHIRSEAPGGPRHDPDYAGDIDGPDNLLLLCGIHHRPVDRHESTYSIEELEAWKVAQRATAGAGTPLDDLDLRSYQRLSDEERQSLKDVARLAQRVTSVCRAAQRDMDAIRAAAEQERQRRTLNMGPMWTVHEDGSRTYITPDIQLSPVEQQAWREKINAAWEPQRLRVDDALVALDEELAVLRMFDHALAEAGEAVTQAANEVANETSGGGSALDTRTQMLNASVSRLWRLANGEIEA